GAASILQILAWMLPVAMLSGHHRYILIAYGPQLWLLWYTIISAVVAIVCGFAFVPAFGAIGAAWALLAANTVLFALAYREVSRLVVRVPFLRDAAMPAAGLAVSLALFFVTRNIWLVTGVATVGY